MAPKKNFLTYIQQKYREFIAKKLAGQNEIIAFLAQIAKYHYLKTSIEKKSIHDIKNIDTIRNDEKLQEFFKKYKNMFYSFYQDQQEEIILNNNLYKKTIDWLIEQWNDIDPTNTNKSTNSNLVKIIQTIAKKLSKGPYIDLALGTGRLLENFKLNQTEVDGAAVPLGNNVLKTKTPVDLYNYGFDIDDNALYLADALLNYKNKDVILNFGNNKDNNSIRNVYKSLKYKEWEKEYPVFMFDPPLGTKSIQAHPAEWKNKKEYLDIFKNNSSNDSTSDVLFLANYLFNAPEKSYFIGIFPESVLNNNTKEYPNLRKYLIQNNLNYVISYDRPDSSRLVILVGTKDKTKLNENILLIKIFNQQGINGLSTGIDTKISDDNVAITEALRTSFDIPYFNIQLPSKIKFTATVVKQLSSKELVEKIFQEEKYLLRCSYRIRKFISENIEEEKETNQKVEPKDYWFQKDKSNQGLICKNTFAYINNELDNYRYNFSKIDKDIQDDNLKNFLSQFYIFYQNNRFNLKTGELDFAQAIKNKKNSYNTDKFILYFTDYYENKNMPNFFKNTIYTKIYRTYCEYWILNKNTVSSEKGCKYLNSELSNAVKILTELGLLKKSNLSKITKDEYYIFNCYRPIFKYIDGEY